MVVGPAFLLLLVPFLALGNFAVQQAACAGSRQHETSLEKPYFLPSVFRLTSLTQEFIFPIMHWYGLTGYSIFLISALFHIKQFLFYRNWLKSTYIGNTRHILHFPYHGSAVYLSSSEFWYKTDHSRISFLIPHMDGQPLSMS